MRNISKQISFCYLTKQVKFFYSFEKSSLVDNDLNSFKKWILNNKDINILINFASITSTVKCDKNKSLALRTNSLAPIKMMKIINNLKGVSHGS